MLKPARVNLLHVFHPIGALPACHEKILVFIGTNVLAYYSSTINYMRKVLLPLDKF
jgi:hypothetical protein